MIQKLIYNMGAELHLFISWPQRKKVVICGLFIWLKLKIIERHAHCELDGFVSLMLEMWNQQRVIARLVKFRMKLQSRMEWYENVLYSLTKGMHNKEWNDWSFVGIACVWADIQNYMKTLKKKHNKIALNRL